MLAWKTAQYPECPAGGGHRDGQTGLLAGMAWCPAVHRKPDLHEGAVEEGPLGDDKVGAEAAGNNLLCGSQLLLGEFQAMVELIQVTPVTRQTHSFSTESQTEHLVPGRVYGDESFFLSLLSPLSYERKELNIYKPTVTNTRCGRGCWHQKTGN